MREIISPISNQYFGVETSQIKTFLYDTLIELIAHLLKKQLNRYIFREKLAQITRAERVDFTGEQITQVKITSLHSPKLNYRTKN